MKNYLIAGNWKMNKTLSETEAFFENWKNLSVNLSDIVEAAFCVPFPFLQVVNEKLKDSKVKTGAQNVSTHSSGAYTGEVSAGQLQSVGVSYCIVGHSERRSYYFETDEQINQKIKQCLSVQLTPILCVGETLDEREKGIEKKVVETQLTQGLNALNSSEIAQIVIAYEPVWAIGTGKTATSAQAQEMHQFIRSVLEKLSDLQTSSKVLILYGGSMNASNAKELLSQPDINGGLIGGASLKPEDFATIIHSAHE